MAIKRMSQVCFPLLSLQVFFFFLVKLNAAFAVLEWKRFS